MLTCLTRQPVGFPEKKTFSFIAPCIGRDGALCVSFLIQQNNSLRRGKRI
jgi:hypothetical protein